MSAQLIQAPDSKVWHVRVFHERYPIRPLCGARSDYWTDAETAAKPPSWRTPHGICSNCAREVESAVRLIATEEASS